MLISICTEPELHVAGEEDLTAAWGYQRSKYTLQRILTEQINGGFQLRIDNRILSSSVSSRCFSVKVDVIIPSIESSARDILALMFGRKYNEFATTFGMKINGRPRGHKTLVEIDVEIHRDFTVSDLQPIWNNRITKNFYNGNWGDRS